MTSVTVKAIEDHADRARARLSNGEIVEADLIITATGVRPNIGFLQDSGIDTDHGILVDHHMQSSREHVYAAGDVAQGRDFSTGNLSVQAIQPTATDHGRIAALNMAGRPVEHKGSINMNVLDTLGLVSLSFGLWMGVEGGDSSEVYDPDAFRYLNLQFDGDRLVGASCVGHTDHMGALRGLIESCIELGEWKTRLMEDPTHIMEAWIGATQAVAYRP
jgi:NAD(P)H-nitrite reductase large subunit